MANVEGGHDRWTGRGGQEHGRPVGWPSGWAGGCSTPARCIGPSRWPRSEAGSTSRATRPSASWPVRIKVQLPPGRVLLDGEDVTAEHPERSRSPGPPGIRPTARASAAGWSNGSGPSPGRGRRRHRGPRPGDDRLPRRLPQVLPDRERRGAGPSTSRRVRRLEGDSIDVEAVLRDLLERDAQDASRAIAPMRPAEDARIIDSTGLDLDQVVDLIERDVLRSAGEPA